MNAKANSIEILAEGNSDTITRLPPHALCADKWENPAVPRWAEVIPLIRRAGEDENDNAIRAASGGAFVAVSIAFPSGYTGEFWETLTSLLLWLCGLLAIGFCLL